MRARLALKKISHMFSQFCLSTLKVRANQLVPFFILPTDCLRTIHKLPSCSRQNRQCMVCSFSTLNKSCPWQRPLFYNFFRNICKTYHISNSLVVLLSTLAQGNFDISLRNQMFHAFRGNVIQDSNTTGALFTIIMLPEMIQKIVC